MQDRHLFFGRRADRAAVEALVLAAPLSLLHATSGAGKTSLINAELIPRLEDRGIICVLARPFGNPEQSLIEETIARVLPAPAHEAKALRRALDALKGQGISGKTELKAFRETVDHGLRAHPEYLDIRGPVPVPKGRFTPRGEAVPFTVRFLIGTGRPLLLARQIDALSRYCGREAPVPPGEEPFVERLARTPVGALVEFFENEQLGRMHAELLENLSRPGGRLAEFFDRLVLLWGSVLDSFRLVVVLDQFEEMFTRFRNGPADAGAGGPGDPAGAGQEHPGRRAAYFRELGELVHRGEGARRPPVNILISMRDDFIAHIDQLEQTAGQIPPSSRFHLETLGRRACREAIAAPAAALNVSYDEQTLSELVADLTRDDGRAEPSHLQIVCARLFRQWQTHGGARGKIGPDHLRPLGGVGGILKRYFKEFLKTIEDSGDPEAARIDRQEVLNILEPLMTTKGTRRPEDLGRLLSPGLRLPSRRRMLVRRLIEARILRTEERHGGSFAEVTHEFLLDHIRAELARVRTEDEHYVPLASALGKLERGSGSHGTETLTRSEYEALWWYRSRLHILPAGDGGTPEEGGEDRMTAKPWLASVLLQEAAAAPWLASAPGDLRTHVRYWAALTDEASKLGIPVAKRMLAGMPPDSGRLGPLELRLLLADGDRGAFTQGELKIILRSAVLSGRREIVRAAAQLFLERYHEPA